MPHLIIPISMSWNVCSHVTSTRSVVWNVLSHVSSTRNILFAVNYHLISTRNLSWTVNVDIGQGESEVVICLPYPIVDQAFSRIYVDHLIVGNSKVYWELNKRLKDPGIYTFQLQVGQTGLVNADDWQNVGNPVVDNFYAIDTVQRLFGKQLLTNYRIKLTTNSGVYYSQPMSVYGKLNKRDWLIAREITRKELLRLSKYTAVDGYLLIMRRSGTVCPCVDPITNEITNSQHSVCYGTGFVGGYYSPLACTFFDLPPDQRKEYRELQGRGMVDDSTKVARFVGYPTIRSRDVFVEKDSDERYYVDTVKGEAALRGVPIVVAPQVHLAPFSDIIYTLNIPR